MQFYPSPELKESLTSIAWFEESLLSSFKQNYVPKPFSHVHCSDLPRVFKLPPDGEESLNKYERVVRLRAELFLSFRPPPHTYLFIYINRRMFKIARQSNSWGILKHSLKMKFPFHSLQIKHVLMYLQEFLLLLSLPLSLTPFLHLMTILS